jgi:hypothetical protein
LPPSAHADAASYTDRADEWLVEKCCESADEGAFAELVRRYRRPVFRLAVSILGQEFAPEAEDVAQERGSLPHFYVACGLAASLAISSSDLGPPFLPSALRELSAAYWADISSSSRVTPSGCSRAAVSLTSRRLSFSASGS